MQLIDEFRSKTPTEAARPEDRDNRAVDDDNDDVDVDVSGLRNDRSTEAARPENKDNKAVDVDNDDGVD